MLNDEMTGKRIRVQSMNDPYVNLKENDLGTVVGQDDNGNLIVDWDKGVTLSITPEIDEFEMVEESKVLKRFYEFKTHPVNLDFVSSKLSAFLKDSFLSNLLINKGRTTLSIARRSEIKLLN